MSSNVPGAHDLQTNKQKNAAMWQEIKALLNNVRHKEDSIHPPMTGSEVLYLGELFALVKSIALCTQIKDCLQDNAKTLLSRMKTAYALLDTYVKDQDEHGVPNVQPGIDTHLAAFRFMRLARFKSTPALPPLVLSPTAAAALPYLSGGGAIMTTTTIQNPTTRRSSGGGGLDEGATMEPNQGQNMNVEEGEEVQLTDSLRQNTTTPANTTRANPDPWTWFAWLSCCCCCCNKEAGAR